MQIEAYRLGLILIVYVQLIKQENRIMNNELSIKNGIQTINLKKNK